MSLHITEKGAADAELLANPRILDGWLEAFEANSLLFDSLVIESPFAAFQKVDR